jgi:hypothetical protein
MRRPIRAVLLGSLLACLIGCKRFDPALYAQTVAATAWTRTTLELPAQTEIMLETRNPTHGVAAALHVWDSAGRVELARSRNASWFGSGQRLQFRNSGSVPRSYQLLVLARSGSAPGSLDIFRDGQPWLRRAKVGGAHLRMAVGAQIVHQVAALPGSPRAATLLGLDAEDHVVALDDSSGPTGLPRLSGDQRIASLVLAAEGADRGSFRVYANDPIDRDGDGLGRRLERALSTCDDPSQSGCASSLLAKFYRSVGTRDTDRDGLTDGDEVFGARGALLDLPRFGADPRHKDVFVEIDHHARLETVGLSEQELVDIAALFRAGGARPLRNPDGLPGVHVHFDAGLVPTKPGWLAVFGDYGGSGSSAASEYRRARAHDFTPMRAGYFRYAFTTRSGRGQTTGDAFTVNRDLARVTIFAHELGHTLGLQHHGHDRWGRENCKPNYRSIMNYLYQSRYEVGFSRSAGRTLNPAGVFERGAARDFPAELLRDPPLEFDMMGRDVDWNRDGQISDQAVRAGLSWGMYKSCGAGEYGSTTLAQRVASTTPVLLPNDAGLSAFWLDEHGQLWWRQARGDLDSLTWSDPAAVANHAGLRQISGTALPDGTLVLAGRRLDGSLAFSNFDADLQLLATSVLEGVHSDDAPSLVFDSVDERYYGTTRLLRVLLRAAGPEGALYQAAARDVRGPFELRRMLAADGLPLTAAASPSIVHLPTGETCGVLLDAQSFMRFFCYEPSRDRWLELSRQAWDNGLGPRSYGRVGLAFHRYRSASGEPIDRAQISGSLYLSFSEPAASNARDPDNPNFYISERLSDRPGGQTRDAVSLRWRGRVSTEWTSLAPGTGVALAESMTRPGLQALMAVRDRAPHSARLEFLPHVDGEFDEPLQSGDDFAVMERGICLGIRSSVECGDESTSDY